MAEKSIEPPALFDTQSLSAAVVRIADSLENIESDISDMRELFEMITFQPQDRPQSADERIRVLRTCDIGG